jgi:hypothetical protein
MPTQCSSKQLEFQGLNRRCVRARFDGGEITSDGGAVLLGELERRLGIIKRLATCFTDGRDGARITHSVSEMLGQRIFALVLGYEDLNDHDQLRTDPILSLISGKDEAGSLLASRSTLNRLEGSRKGAAERYHRIGFDSEAIDRLLVDVFIESHSRAPAEVILDLDATDDPVHGQQQGRFFHGYYRHYCYLPLYIFSGDHLLCARLRRSNMDASKGSVEELEPIVERIRSQWPTTRILLRADSGFARERLMKWCEDRGVDYLFGLARNDRLVDMIASRLEHVRRKALRYGEPVRHFDELTYQTRKSWSRKRRVVAKAEHLPQKANPRFVVTSLSKEEVEAKRLYEEIYCARGDMENRIKEQQLDLFADRTSCHVMQANQLRLYLSSFAYVLFNEFRRLLLKGTRFARARAGTIRRKLFKIGALVQVSVRRFWIHFSSAYPYQTLFELAYTRLEHVPMRC